MNGAPRKALGEFFWGVVPLKANHKKKLTRNSCHLGGFKLSIYGSEALMILELTPKAVYFWYEHNTLGILKSLVEGSRQLGIH